MSEKVAGNESVSRSWVEGIQRERADLTQRVQEQAQEIGRLMKERDEWQRRALDRDLETVRLRAELERLTPSGQVEEGVRQVLEGLKHGHSDAGALASAEVALSRLAAGAQSAQAKEAEIAELRRLLRDSQSVSEAAAPFLAAAENFCGLPPVIGDGFPEGSWKWRFERLKNVLPTLGGRVRREKDATIKALADYIQFHGGHEGGCGAFDGSRFVSLDLCTCPLGAALRLAGRPLTKETP